LYHQEWYDGSGYPRGISGKDIPIEARIISVSDAFEAMTSDRCYRKALTLEEVTAELVQGKGSQFAHFIINDFLEILENKENIVNKIMTEKDFIA